MEQTFPQEPLLDLKDSQQEIKDSNIYNKPKPLWCVCFFFVCMSVSIVLSFWGGGGRGEGGFSSVWSELSLNKVTFLHFTLTVLTFLNLNVKAV